MKKAIYIFYALVLVQFFARANYFYSSKLRLSPEQYNLWNFILFNLSPYNDKYNDPFLLLIFLFGLVILFLLLINVFRKNKSSYKFQMLNQLIFLIILFLEMVLFISDGMDKSGYRPDLFGKNNFKVTIELI
ncbi:MAG: hypothetical protein ABI723_22610 [Bacteroidia bacterium]